MLLCVILKYKYRYIMLEYKSFTRNFVGIIYTPETV